MLQLENKNNTSDLILIINAHINCGWVWYTSFLHTQPLVVQKVSWAITICRVFKMVFLSLKYSYCFKSFHKPGVVIALHPSPPKCTIISHARSCLPRNLAVFTHRSFHEVFTDILLLRFLSVPFPFPSYSPVYSALSFNLPWSELE